MMQTNLVLFVLFGLLRWQNSILINDLSHHLKNDPCSCLYGLGYDVLS